MDNIVHPFNAVGVYVFAGGFSLGVRNYFNILAHCEDPKPYGLEVIRSNQRYWENLPIYPWPNWDKVPENLDFIYANPPCAPFSNNNVNSYIPGSWKSDPRIKCWSNIVELAIAKKARVVALETVPQAYTKAEELVRETIDRLLEHYEFVYLIFHNIALMGAIQNRNRLFIVGSEIPLHLSDHQFSIPKETVADRLRLVKEPGWGLPVSPKYTEIVKATMPGESMRDAFNRVVPANKRSYNSRGHVIGRPSFNIKRLDPNERVNTLCGFAHIHPVENRYVSVKEYQVMAGYPVDYLIPGKCEGYGYISRAVSPEAGRWLARIVHEALANYSLTGFRNIKEVTIFDGISRGTVPYIHPIVKSQPFPRITLSRKY